VKVVVIQIRCPYCGRWITLSHEIIRQPKGYGAHYAHKIKKLSRTHIVILSILYFYGNKGKTPLPKRKISYLLHKKGIKISGNEVSARLSELHGLGFVKFEKSRIKLLDEERQKYRYVKIPHWYLTDRGLRKVLELKKEGLI